MFEEGNYNTQEDIKDDNHSDISSQDSYTENQGYTGPLDDMENQTISMTGRNRTSISKKCIFLRKSPLKLKKVIFIKKKVFLKLS